jgi:formylglycine-generating enzyme required for sulfatase activity
MFEKNNMKKIIFQLMSVVLCLSARAQSISNIRAEQRGQDIVVFYSLETISPCEVNLLLSQDNGVTWGSTLKNVSGDVGKSITSGDKQIIWKVLEEREQFVGDNLKFKVIANGKKSFEPELVLVEGGTFQMGSKRERSSERPVHEVTLSSFYIGKFEVTQDQWSAIMGSNPSERLRCGNCPVDNVSPSDVQVYIQRLNEESDKSYRLPTEAEWEYAARGGKYSKGYVFAGSNDVNDVAWIHSPNSSKREKVHEVGTKKPNELGIYDMSGNVCEWCSDWLGKYSRHSQINPKGPTTGTYYVIRSGSVGRGSSQCTVAYRFGWNTAMTDTGFRLVLPVE